MKERLKKHVLPFVVGVFFALAAVKAGLPIGDALDIGLSDTPDRAFCEKLLAQPEEDSVE